MEKWKLASSGWIEQFQEAINADGVESTVEKVYQMLKDDSALSEEELGVFWSEHGWAFMDIVMANDPSMAKNKHTRHLFSMFARQSPPREVLMAIMEYLVNINSSPTTNLFLIFTEASVVALERTASEKTRMKMSTSIAERLVKLLKQCSGQPTDDACLAVSTKLALILQGNEDKNGYLEFSQAILTILLAHIDWPIDISAVEVFVTNTEISQHLYQLMRKDENDSIASAVWFYYTISHKPMSGQYYGDFPHFSSAALELLLQNTQSSHDKIAQKGFRLVREYIKHLESYNLDLNSIMNPYFIRIKNALIYYMSHAADPKMRLDALKLFENLISTFPDDFQLPIILQSHSESIFVNFKTVCVDIVKRKLLSRSCNADFSEVCSRLLKYESFDYNFQGIQAVSTYHMQILNFICSVSGKLSSSQVDMVKAYLKSLKLWMESRNAEDVEMIDHLYDIVFNIIISRNNKI